MKSTGTISQAAFGVAGEAKHPALILRLNSELGTLSHRMFFTPTIVSTGKNKGKALRDVHASHIIAHMDGVRFDDVPVKGAFQTLCKSYLTRASELNGRPVTFETETAAGEDGREYINVNNLSIGSTLTNDVDAFVAAAR